MPSRPTDDAALYAYQPLRLEVAAAVRRAGRPVTSSEVATSLGRPNNGPIAQVLVTLAARQVVTPQPARKGKRSFSRYRFNPAATAALDAAERANRLGLLEPGRRALTVPKAQMTILATYVLDTADPLIEWIAHIDDMTAGAIVGLVPKATSEQVDELVAELDRHGVMAGRVLFAAVTATDHLDAWARRMTSHGPDPALPSAKSGSDAQPSDPDA